MRYIVSFFITSTLYASIAIGFFYAFDFTKGVEKKEELKKVSLNYVQIVKPKPKPNVTVKIRV